MTIEGEESAKLSAARRIEGRKLGEVVAIEVGQHSDENKAGKRWNVAMANIDPGLNVSG